MKNYYLILGVKSDATSEQIRAAYRRQAKELHPDYYGRDSGPFIDLQEAYSVLSDPVRRRSYDDVFHHSYRERGRASRVDVEPLYSRRSSPEPLVPEQNQVDLGQLSLTRDFRTFGPSFDELFERLLHNFNLVRPKVERIRSLNVEIRVTRQEARRGGRVRILVPARLRCPVCRGHGGVGFYECNHCEGAGVVQGEYPINLMFPPGIVNNYMLEVPLDRFGISNFYLRAIFRVSDDTM